MLIISSVVLNGLITEIASRARSVTDHNGEQIMLPTMSDRQLRSAALIALQVATGEVIWPADQKISLRRKESVGPVQIED